MPDVPVFSQDIEFPAPEAVRRVRKAVADADALWIVSPEYNHGVPGGLKNLRRGAIADAASRESFVRRYVPHHLSRSRVKPKAVPVRRKESA